MPEFIRKIWTPFEWEGEVFRLLSQRALRGSVQRVPSKHQGDWGIDFYCAQSGEVIQCYSPEEPVTTAARFTKQRDKITKDILKLKLNDKALLQLGGEKGWIRHWTLAVPIFDDKRLLTHAARKQQQMRSLGAESLASDFNIIIASHEDLERAAAPSPLSDLSPQEILEILRPILYRHSCIRDRRKMEQTLKQSGLQKYFTEVQGKPNSRLALCMSILEQCLMTRNIEPALRFLQTLANSNKDAGSDTIKLILSSRLFTSNTSAQSNTGLTQPPDPIFSFPKPRFFFGRDAMLSELIREVPQHRLITVFGSTGGLGKTTLACQTASKLQERQIFKDGIIFIDLEEATSTQGALLSFCKSLRLSGPTTTEGVIRHLEGKHLLLIVDNIETVLQHDRMAFRKFVGKLLDYTTANFLCTGRDCINLPDEKLISPRPLEPHEAECLLEHHLNLRSGNSDSAKHASFETILDICDGIPLAIELVASWLPGHSLDSYVTEFNRLRAGALRNPSLSIGDRLTNYTVSTHLTYQLLPAYAQELLRYASILPAAPKLSMLPPLLNGDKHSAISELKHRNLIHTDETHLKVLIPIREAIRLLAKDTDIERVSSFILESVYQNENPGRLVLEQHANLSWSLIKALGATSNNANLSRLVEIVLSLEDFYVRAGLLGESKEILETTLSRLKDNSLPAPFRLHCFRGNIERLLDNYSASEACYQDALSIGTLGGIERARVLIGQGNVQKQIQKYSDAETSFREALEIATSIGTDAAIQGQCLWGLANVEFATSQWEQAKKSYKRALSAFQQVPPSPETLRGIIDCHKGLCDIYIKQRRLQEAETSITAALTLFYDPYFEFNNRFTEAKIQQGLGDVKRLIVTSAEQRGEDPSGGDYKAAEQAYQKAIQIYHEMRAPIGEALSYYKLGELYVFSSSGLEQAKGCFLTAASIFEQCGNHLGRAKAHLALLKLDILANGPKQRYLERAHELLGVFRDICGSPYWQAETHLTIAACRRHGADTNLVNDLEMSSQLFMDLGRVDKMEVIDMIQKGVFGITQAFWE